MLVPVLVAGATVLMSFLYSRLRHRRFLQYAAFPQHAPSLLLGHLRTVYDFASRLPAKAHSDMAFAAMHEALGRPAVMLVDLRPVTCPLLVVASHEVAEQISRPTADWPYTPPKAPEIGKQLEPLNGARSIVSADGEAWRELRWRFNPAFAPQHLMSLLPFILDKVLLFTRRLDALARDGSDFSLQRYTTDLALDVIGRVALHLDMGAQTEAPAELTRVFRSLLSTYSDDPLDLPWWFTPRREWKRYGCMRWIRERLRAMVREQYLEQGADNSSGDGSSSNCSSILSIGLRDVQRITPDMVDVTCDQLSTFLFAGHDTTGTLVSWALYELSRTPHALAAVRAELDTLFGPDPRPCSMRARLLAPGGDQLVRRMSYTTAVLKETLRLWPPAASSRNTRPGSGYTVSVPPHGDLCVDGVMVYMPHYLIQRNRRVYGDSADHFVPERWLRPWDDGHNAVPASAWRPFERGPRNCIGQELATVEARLVVALAARRYDFTKTGRGAPLRAGDGTPLLGEHGQYRVGSDMYMTRQVTSKPVDGMMMKVHFCRNDESDGSDGQIHV